LIEIKEKEKTANGEERRKKTIDLRITNLKRNSISQIKNR
jgi:hypothetical protein